LLRSLANYLRETELSIKKSSCVKKSS
jgi:hypothetical protein